MQNHWLAYFFFLLFPFSQINAQTILQQGTVHYRMSSTNSSGVADTVNLSILFSPDAAVWSRNSPQEPGSGEFLVLNYPLGQSQGFVYMDGDTIPTVVKNINNDLGNARRYKLKVSETDKKTILGYSCKHFVCTPKDGSKKSNIISGWMTDKIKTKAVPVIDLYNQLPGFPLEVSLEDSRSGETILFEANHISLLDTSLLRNYQNYIGWTATSRSDAVQRAAQDFYNDTTVRLEIPIPSDWTIVEYTSQDIYLRNDALKATVRFRRKLPKTDEDIELQLEKLVVQSSSYLQDVLRLPVPTLKGLFFLDQPNMQRTWRYSNAKNYVFRDYFNGQNPYDYFPLAELVETHRAFLMQDILYNGS